MQQLCSESDDVIARMAISPTDARIPFMITWQRFGKRLVLLAAVAVFPACGTRLAAQEKTWVGETVLQTKPHKDIRFVDRMGDKVVEYAFSGIWPFLVRDEKDGW